MGKSTPSAPAPVDPKATASAQTAQNIGTAVVNNAMRNVNQVTPYGNLTYEQTGSKTYTDPNSGDVHNLPQYTATQTFTPEGQKIHQSTVDTQQNLADIGRDQSASIKTLLSSSMDKSGVTALPSSEIGNIGAVNTDFSAQRQQAQDALMQRMQPMQDRQRGQLESRLASQGIRMGSAAYDDAIESLGRTHNDANLAAIGQARGEQQFLQGQAMQQQQAANAAASQRFNMGNTIRGQQLNELAADRARPLNEISALRSGSQVQNPNFITPNMASVANTDYAGMVNNQYAQQMAAHTQGMQQQGQFMGGLLGLGGSLGGAAIMASDMRVKKDIVRIGTYRGHNLYKFEYTDGLRLPEGVQYGVMAQEVEQTNPDAVMTIDGIKHVNYGMI